jgi:hypothetical protein
MGSKITIDVKDKDAWIRVYVDQGFATIQVVCIDDVGIVYRALNQAVAAGAISGTMLTGEIVEKHMAAMHDMRARTGITWLGGKVTWLADRANGPEYRIDWDVLPTVTE